MKTRVFVIMVSFTLILILTSEVFCQNQIEYEIKIESDGSARWIIRIMGDEVSIDFFEFENRVTSLVATTENETGRGMVAVRDSFSLTLNYSGSYSIVECRFHWINFSKTENQKIIIGDVFQSQNLFLQLYGDGEVCISYPSEYVLETVSPTPYDRNDSTQTLRWLGSNDFLGKFGIILHEKSVTPGLTLISQEIMIIIAVVLSVASVASVGLYLFKRHTKKEKEIGIPEYPTPLGIENAEDKIVKLLDASGGSLHQTAIVNQCRFSKAKTSQLLTILENKGVIKRYKMGRRKIITLIKKVEK
ncbi:MAG: hypothetical protein PVF96_06075 [Candidatus Bathyarchaeota archaeon]